MKIHFQIILIILVSIPSFYKANAQFGFYYGRSISTVKSDKFIDDPKSINTGALGLSVQYFPFKNEKISFINEFGFSNKGYKQELNNDTYKIRFTYFSMPVLFSYSINNFTDIHTGVEFSPLLGYRIKKNSEILDTESNVYNGNDLGIVLGAYFIPDELFNLLIRFNYGLKPVLTYQEIGDNGEFKDSVNDLNNFTFTFGFKINFIKKRLGQDEITKTF